VARRIEIELTSARADGTWTWRAAGALNPRGALDGSLLYSGAKAGDIVRAEAEFSIDGITVVSVEPPRRPEGEDPNRIEVLARPAVAGVTTELAGRKGPSRLDGRKDEERGNGERGNRGTAAPGRPRPEGRGRAERRAMPHQGGGERAGGGSSDGHTRRARRPGERPQPGAGHPAAAGSSNGAGRHPKASEIAAPVATPASEAGARPVARPSGSPEARHRGGPTPEVARRRGFSFGNAHRTALLASLPPEHQPIAQQLMRGGIPAVRTALYFERERARAEGRPEPSTEGVLAIAESLASRVKAAEWHDRAEAAVRLGDELPTRDLRLLVNGSDQARDEPSRALAATLREMLERRTEAHRQSWEAEVAKLLDEGQVLKALRLSARPPDPGAKFSAALATRLRDAAGLALAPEVPAERWLALLQAAADSPVRRAVKPVGLPEKAAPEVLEAARQQCGRVPALAPLLGLPVPPPPGPARPFARPGVRRPLAKPSLAKARPAKAGPRGAGETAPEPPPGLGAELPQVRDEGSGGVTDEVGGASQATGP
jgi:hypothetical protein